MSWWYLGCLGCLGYLGREDLGKIQPHPTTSFCDGWPWRYFDGDHEAMAINGLFMEILGGSSHLVSGL